MSDVPEPKIPESLAAIDPAWLTQALRSSGNLGRGQVVSCRIEQIGADTGFASVIGRVEARYRHADGGAPASMVVKLAMASDDGDLRHLTGEKNRRESAFYRELAGDVALRVPTCYFVAHDPADGRIALLLEDLGEARFGDDGAGCSLADAELVIDSLAAMHARWWKGPRLDRLPWLPAFGDAAVSLRRLPERRRRFLDRYGDLVSDEMRSVTQRLGPRHAPLLGTLAGPPVTLLHVDTHLDNVAFVKVGADAEVVLFDWQGVARGLCVVDVSSFLVSALHGRDRRHEGRLIERYHRALVHGGVGDYGLTRLRGDYRVAMLRWWLGTVNGYGSAHAASWTGRQAALARASLQRWDRIIRDLDLGALL